MLKKSCSRLRLVWLVFLKNLDWFGIDNLTITMPKLY